MNKKLCLICEKEILYDLVKDRKSKFENKKYCSFDCYSLARTASVKDIDKNCLYCGDTLKRNIKERPISFTKRQFCNKSCCNKSRTTTKICSNCGCVKTNGAKYCKSCHDNFKKIAVKDRSLGESLSSNRNKFGQVRGNAVEVMKETGLEKKCKICGFDYHVEVCHIKPISSFPLSTPMREVNSLENLVYLCPNHHIMLDRGMIKL